MEVFIVELKIKDRWEVYWLAPLFTDENEGKEWIETVMYKDDIREFRVSKYVRS